MLAVAVALYALGCVCSFAAEAETTNTVRFESKEDHFTITLPSGWKEMEPELAAVFVDPGRFSNSRDVKAYGYELASAKGLLETPFVAVQVVRTARIPERFLAVLSNNELRRKTVGDMLKREGVLERDILETSYNTNRNLLRMSITKVDRQVGRLRALNGIVFTEVGSINVSCLAKADEFDSWSARFEKIVDSFQIDPAIRYRPRSAAEVLAPARARASYLLIMALASPAIGLIYFLCRRYADNVRSDEI